MKFVIRTKSQNQLIRNDLLAYYDTVFVKIGSCTENIAENGIMKIVKS